MKSLVGWSKELYENDEGELYERGERGEEGKTNKPLPRSVGSVETPQRKSDHDTSRFERQMMYNQQVCFPLFFFSLPFFSIFFLYLFSLSFFFFFFPFSTQTHKFSFFEDQKRKTAFQPQTQGWH